MAAPLATNVDLGFIEEITEKWRFKSHYFPSKVGGRPAWLALSNLPSTDSLQCRNCQNKLTFLLQIYAPLSEDADPEVNHRAFHRSLFLFCCKSTDCSTLNSVKAFRSQLHRANEYYSDEPPPEKFSANIPCPSAKDYQKMCVVCGCPGDKVCGKCKLVNYCCREHQVSDWKECHKTICGSATDVSDHENKQLFPELELVMENEQIPEVHEKSEAETMAEYEELLQSGKVETVTSSTAMSDLEKMATGEEVLDKKFKQFKKRIAPEPEQVIRYDRGGEPLWVSEQNIPKPDDIPPCSCGARRIFEFQVLPQLLNHLNVTTVEACLDWGTLAVYTCQVSCDNPNINYSHEFVWKQDINQ